MASGRMSDSGEKGLICNPFLINRLTVPRLSNPLVPYPAALDRMRIRAELVL
jgi:hypothetical protein